MRAKAASHMDDWSEEQRQRTGRALQIIFGAILLGSLFCSAVCLASGWYETFWVVVGVVLSTSAALFVGRLGHDRIASIAALGFLVCALCYSAYRGNGIHDLSIMIIPVVIVVAGLLLEGASFVLFTTATIFAICVVGLLRWWFGPADPLSTNSAAELAVIVTFIAIAAFVGRLLTIQLLQGWLRARENEARYRRIFESIQDVYYEMRPDGLLLEISPAAESLFLAKPEEMIGASLLPFYPETSCHEDFIKALRKSGKITNYEMALLDRERNRHFVLINASILEGTEAGSEKVVGSITDITDRRELEEHLIQAQKMESIGTLTGGIAHDFNNLLTVINGHSELALLKTQNAEDPAEDIKAIHRAGTRAAELTRQLLAFGRKQTFKPAVVDIRSMLSHWEPMARTLLGEDIRLEEIVEADTPRILADPSQLEQIMINLLVNARDAINEKTGRSAEKRITIRSRELNLPNPGKKGVEPGRYLMLEISDNGVGMRPEVKGRVFDPFFTTKNAGTGLGLATVYGIVIQNKGAIEVESEPMAGATFRILWPATEADFEQSSPSAEHAPRGTEGILLVEDDEAVLRFAQSALSAHGYEPLYARNGRQALDVLRRNAAGIQLLITDVVMPEMDGKELAQEARGLLPGLKILFTSGYPKDRISHGGELDAGLLFIPKPYSALELAIKVREALDSV